MQNQGKGTCKTESEVVLHRDVPHVRSCWMCAGRRRAPATGKPTPLHPAGACSQYPSIANHECHIRKSAVGACSRHPKSPILKATSPSKRLRSQQYFDGARCFAVDEHKGHMCIHVLEYHQIGHGGSQN